MRSQTESKRCHEVVMRLLEWSEPSITLHKREAEYFCEELEESREEETTLKRKKKTSKDVGGVQKSLGVTFIVLGRC